MNDYLYYKLIQLALIFSNDDFLESEIKEDIAIAKNKLKFLVLNFFRCHFRACKFQFFSEEAYPGNYSVFHITFIILGLTTRSNPG